MLSKAHNNNRIMTEYKAIFVFCFGTLHPPNLLLSQKVLDIRIKNIARVASTANWHGKATIIETTTPENP